ncbi:disintegrin and metalloproteinase domain-containing protein 19-like isoform X2 [Macrobrachium rosenbergii]|uniref:disintegrin and metalloproteinase domain-containing protein 19-like isoform X2 n=1 Tax=Macrobrachium rosenbergii TaxID=79674 RepID=UPI0034D632B8
MIKSGNMPRTPLLLSPLPLPRLPFLLLPCFSYISFFSIFLSVVTVGPLSAHGLEVTSSGVTSRHPETPTVILSPKTAPSHVFTTSMPRVIDGKLPAIANGSATLVTSPASQDVDPKEAKATKAGEEEEDPQVTRTMQSNPESSDPKSSHLVETSLEKLMSTMKSRREDEILEEGDDDAGDAARVDGEDEVVNCNYKEVAETNVGTGAEEDNGVAYLKHERKNHSNFVSDAEGEDVWIPETADLHSRVRREAITLHGPLWTDKNTLFVELVAIADYDFCQKYRGGTIDRIAKIVGVANMVFAPLGVVVVLADVELWSSGNMANVYPTKEQTLNSINKYRENLIKNDPRKLNDNVMLITTKIENGAGVASVGGMCSEDRSVNIIQDVSNDFPIVGLLLAHEMGHNFKMKHDGPEGGEYVPGIGRCDDYEGSIMQPSLSLHSSLDLEWSICSKNYIATMRKTDDLDCLKNIPTESYRSVCGNGIVESGEDCDCGIPELCKNPCCNPSTCRFAPRARCASGACCNTATCQPHTAGRVCRGASDSCDLSEYCSGDSERCPDDVHKGDGSYCGYYSQGHCYKGKCGAHDERCQKMWGSGATAADAVCFKDLNKLNDRHGNCGQDPVTKEYINCDDQALKCGTLYCNNNGYGKVEVGERTSYHVNQQWVESSICQYVEGYISHYPKHSWLSPDGASCGDRKMCVNQKCIRVPGTDDALECSKKCSGRGMCNSKGHCHCNPGYAPPDCSQPGSGGSYDSGPAGEGSSGGVIAAFVILILVLLLVILLIIMCCNWDRLRRWWDNTGRSKVSPVAPKAVSCIDNCFCVAVSKAVKWVVSHSPMGKLSKPGLSDPGMKKPRNKSPGYRVDVQVKRMSHPDFIDVEGQHTEKILQQKPLLPPGLPNKHLDNVTRPKYEQSISVDSGCVIDDRYESPDSHSTNVSMSSLVSVFRNYSSKTSSETVQAENRRSLMQDHLKEVSLRRLVTDPRSGHHNSKHGLPQPYQKPPDSRHSVSADLRVKNTNHPEKLANNHHVISDKDRKNDKSLPNVSILDSSVKKPIIPPYRSRTPPAMATSRVTPPRTTPPRATPPREAPPRPPVHQDEVKIISGKRKSASKFKDQDKVHVPNVTKQKTGPVKSEKAVNECPKKDNKPSGPQVPGNRSVRNLAQKFENS